MNSRHSLIAAYLASTIVSSAHSLYACRAGTIEGVSVLMESIFACEYHWCTDHWHISEALTCWLIGYLKEVADPWIADANRWERRRDNLGARYRFPYSNHTAVKGAREDHVCYRDNIIEKDGFNSILFSFIPSAVHCSPFCFPMCLVYELLLYCAKHAASALVSSYVNPYHVPLYYSWRSNSALCCDRLIR